MKPEALSPESGIGFASLKIHLEKLELVGCMARELRTRKITLSGPGRLSISQPTNVGLVVGLVATGLEEGAIGPARDCEVAEKSGR